jgi:hypothetical protein
MVMWHETLKPGQYVSHDIENRNRFVNNEGKSVIHIAIIDYLQEYNVKKMIESKYKMGCKNRKKAFDQVTIVPPDHYAERFKKYMIYNVLERKDDEERDG